MEEADRWDDWSWSEIAEGGDWDQTANEASTWAEKAQAADFRLIVFDCDKFQSIGLHGVDSLLDWVAANYAPEALSEWESIRADILAPPGIAWNINGQTGMIVVNRDTATGELGRALSMFAGLLHSQRDHRCVTIRRDEQ
ncbi:hypothetical protein AB0N09_34455 [Streptomyces erythrochromogenes]|uniref:hypothetical protein n=1 Tax=Streptomyces erythrochromogenes TaxID=285574 RepID=UPI0034243163